MIYIKFNFDNRFQAWVNVIHYVYCRQQILFRNVHNLIFFSSLVVWAISICLPITFTTNWVCFSVQFSIQIYYHICHSSDSNGILLPKNVLTYCEKTLFYRSRKTSRLKTENRMCKIQFLCTYENVLLHSSFLFSLTFRTENCE